MSENQNLKLYSNGPIVSMFVIFSFIIGIVLVLFVYQKLYSGEVKATEQTKLYFSWILWLLVIGFLLILITLMLVDNTTYRGLRGLVYTIGWLMIFSALVLAGIATEDKTLTDVNIKNTIYGILAVLSLGEFLSLMSLLMSYKYRPYSTIKYTYF